MSSIRLTRLADRNKGWRLRGLLAVVLLCLASPVAADPFGVSGNWNYRESGGDEIETSSSLNSSYSLNFDKELTSAMNLSADARYNENRPSGGGDSETFSPSASFDLRNDLFSLNLSGSENRLDSEGKAPFVNRSWGVNLYSQVRDWPNLRLSYNGSHSYDELSMHQRDAESSHLGASLEHSMGGFDLLYDLSLGTSDDLVADTTGDSERHFSQVRFSESFLQGRLSFAVTQQYSDSRSETEISPDEDGVYLDPVLIDGASSGDDDTPTTGSLADNPALIDGDLGTSAGIVIDDASKVQNLGLRVFNSVSRIRVVFDDEISPADRALLNWAVYTSAGGTNWSEVPQTLAISYVLENGRSVALLDTTSFPVAASHVKAVVRATAAPSTALSVTEVEAGELLTTTASRVRVVTEFVSHQTQVSLGYRPAADWFTGYNLRRVLNQPGGGPENDQLSQSLNVSYSPSRLFSASLAISESRDETDGVDERIGRAYSLSMNSAPLQTLDLSLAYSRSDSFDGGRKESTNDTINGSLAATIFPNLSASLAPNWSRAKSPETGVETTTYGMNLTSSARLTPKLDLNLSWTYSHSATEGGEGEETSTSSQQYGSTWSYRPSDILLFNANIDHIPGEDSTPFSGNVAWQYTRKIQTNAGVSLDLSQGKSRDYDASVSWSVNRHISLQGGGGYQVGESGDSWNLTTSLNATY